MTDHERLNAVRRTLALDAGHAEHRLACLRELLDELDADGWPYKQDDPPASWLVLDASRKLLDGLTAAFQDELPP